MGWHPIAVVQYTFTHKQYIEQHNETEYLERNIYNNKNTWFTKLNRNIQSIKTCTQWYKIEPNNVKECDKK